jgi:hypothetical protein
MIMGKMAERELGQKQEDENTYTFTVHLLTVETDNSNWTGAHKFFVSS